LRTEEEKITAQQEERARLLKEEEEMQLKRDEELMRLKQEEEKFRFQIESEERKQEEERRKREEERRTQEEEERYSQVTVQSTESTVTVTTASGAPSTVLYSDPELDRVQQSTTYSELNTLESVSNSQHAIEQEMKRYEEEARRKIEEEEKERRMQELRRAEEERRQEQQATLDEEQRLQQVQQQQQSPPEVSFHIPEELWYYGDIQRQKAEALLISCGANVVLVRNSSVPGCYALSKYDHIRQTMLHLLIKPAGAGAASGYKIEDCNDSTVYRSLVDLLARAPICKGFKFAGQIKPQQATRRF